MPVQWVKVEMPLGGLDALSDAVHVVPGKLPELVNGRYDQPGGISKRPNHVDLGVGAFAILGGGTINTGRRLWERVGGEWGIITDRGFYSWSPVAAAWVFRGETSNIVVQRDVVYYDQLSSIDNPSIAGISNVELVRWRSTGALNCFLRSRVNGAEIVKENTPGTFPTCGRIFAQENAIGDFFFYSIIVQATTIQWSRINTATPGTKFGAHVAFSPSIASNDSLILDVQPILNSNDFIIAYKRNAGGSGAGNILVERWTTASTPAQVWTREIAEIPDEAIAVWADDNDQVYVAWSSVANNLKYAVLNVSNGAVTLGATPIQASTAVTRIAIQGLTSANAVVCWEDQKGAAGSPPSERLPFVRWRRVNASGLQGTERICSDVAIVARPYIQAARVFLPVCHTGDGYGHGLLLEIAENTTPEVKDPGWVATFARNVCQPDLDDDNDLTGGGTKSDVANSYSLDGVSVHFPIRTRDRLNYAKANDDPTLLAHTGIARVRVIHGVSQRNWVQWGRGLFVASGRPSWYDGSQLTEHGFAWQPSLERDTVGDLNNTGGGIFANGEKYQAMLTWLWEDINGMRDESEPSAVMERTIVGSTQQLRIRLRNTLLSDRIPPASAWWKTTGSSTPRALPYRTEGQGVTTPGPRFYRAMAETGAAIPGHASPSADIDFGTALDNDAAIVNREVIYTDGGILPNTCTPPAEVCHVHQGRLWLAQLEDPHNLLYSQPFVETELPRFNANLGKRIDEPVWALNSLDDALIAFSPGSIRQITGYGPPAAGSFDDGLTVERITSESGSLFHRSVVAMPLGLMFVAKSGIKLLTRGRTIEDTGAAVHKYFLAFPTAIAAALCPHKHQVRFIQQQEGGGTQAIFTYDYRVGEWSVDTPPGGATFVDIRTIGVEVGTPQTYLLDSSGRVWLEASGGSFIESFIQLYFATSWIRLDTVQGWQRVRSVNILGIKPSDPASITVQAFYDYEESTVVQTRTWSKAEILALPFTRLQLKVRLKRQKCQAIKLKVFEEHGEGDGRGDELRIQSIVFEAGLKRGTAKLPPAAKK